MRSEPKLGHHFPDDRGTKIEGSPQMFGDVLSGCLPLHVEFVQNNAAGLLLLIYLLELVVFFTRFTVLGLSLIIAIVAVFYVPEFWAIGLALASGTLALMGLYDLTQPLHSVRRNYPIIGRLRWLFEAIRPEIRQYFIEGDGDEAPFSRNQRSLVYARAKNESSDRAFGTSVDVYANGYEFIAHSTMPTPVADPSTFRINIGGEDCAQPYSASIFNISAMSFGALSANAILALNKGATLGSFAHDTGEGSISP